MMLEYCLTARAMGTSGVSLCRVYHYGSVPIKNIIWINS